MNITTRLAALERVTPVSTLTLIVFRPLVAPGDVAPYPQDWIATTLGDQPISLHRAADETEGNFEALACSQLDAIKPGGVWRVMPANQFGGAL